MANGRILVIAPEIDLRRSLEFALEAEGFLVTVRADIDLNLDLLDGSFDCTVLDQAALVGPPDRIISFCARAKPILLLADNPIHWLSASITARVEKPMLGGALSNAIGLALQRSA
ncbi:MAG TPA: hypothetical protein VGO70_00845 [Arsenicitalea sp.]|jgi:DNA-binding response OmpR family regulator|nr:hypothetical protein [Arsenicitalea sp.]